LTTPRFAQIPVPIQLNFLRDKWYCDSDGALELYIVPLAQSELSFAREISKIQSFDLRNFYNALIEYNQGEITFSFP